MVLIRRNGATRTNYGRFRCRNAYRQFREFCSNCSILIFIAGCTILFIALLVAAYYLLHKSVHVVVINGNVPLRNKVGSRFLSIAIDTSVIAEGFRDFDVNNKKVHLLLSAMSPAYLRIGGTMADRLYFVRNNTYHFKTNVFSEIDGGSCTYEFKRCDSKVRPNFTMSGDEWLNLYKAIKNAGLVIIFDLNVLLRTPANTWDWENAKALLDFSQEHNMELHFELGNEPNAFRHVFNYEVNATQMAKDFTTLRNLLNSYPLYKNSWIFGPDVTRPLPNHRRSMKYLEEFLLSGGAGVVKAVTWHQYYLNGRTATPNNFVDVDVLNMLQTQIGLIKKLMSDINLPNKQLWLGETGSAYGGGAPGMSDRFIGSFMFLDKLGIAAKNGIEIVIRQSFVRGHYAMVANYEPNPDFWISVVYKMLVGRGVFNCNVASSPWVRIYCHCATKSQSRKPSVTIFALNVHEYEAYVRIQGIDINDKILEYYEIESYIFTARNSIFSRRILLNNEELMITDRGLPTLTARVYDGRETMVMPPFSMGFWVVRDAYVGGCFIKR